MTRFALVPGLAVALVLATLALTAPAQAQRIRPGFFGMHDSRIAYDSVPGVSAGSIRLWDTGTSWREIETVPTVFDFSTVDRAVDRARSAGLRPMLVLGQTPRFHASRPNEAAAYGDGAASMPSLTAWKSYVRRVANHLGNTVDYQVWNEPNVINYWTGSVAQMATLTKTASRIITDVVGRRATVVAPSFPLRLRSQQEWYRKYWSGKLGMAGFVDVVAVNLYPLEYQAPEAQLKLLRFARVVLPDAARRRSMWNTEINYGLRGGPDADPISEAKQASYVARTLFLNAASPIRRTYWYSWGIGPIANTHLVESDRTTLTRAGRAWGVARGWINGTNVGACTNTTRGKLKGLWTCVARNGTTEVRRIYWKPSGSAVRVATHRTTRSWTSLSGTTTFRKGRFGLRVGLLPVMVKSRS